MAGDFKRLLLWTILLSLGVFGIIALLSWLAAGLSPGETFINLTNPVRSRPDNAWEWVAIVVANLCGLAVIEGIILTLLINWVSNRKSRHLSGEARYDFIFSKPHATILGGHPLVANMAADLINSADNEYVLIQTRGDIPELRKQIKSLVGSEDDVEKIVIYTGSRTSMHELRELRLHTSTAIYIIGESEEIDGTSTDALNLECRDIINRLYEESQPSEVKIDCHVMLLNPSSFKAFQFTDIPSEKNGIFRFFPFGYYETHARQVLTSRPENSDNPYIPLDGRDGISFYTPERVHLIVIGMTDMGKAMAIEAAHIAHYPNFLNPSLGNPRTLITFIDRDAKEGMAQLSAEYRDLFLLARRRFIKADYSGIVSDETFDPLNDPDSMSPYAGNYLGENLIDIEFEFIEGDVYTSVIQKYLSESCSPAGNKAIKDLTTIIVACEDSGEAFSIASNMEDAVYDHALQILVYQKKSGALVETLASGKTAGERAKFAALKPFGMAGDFSYVRLNDDMLPLLVAYVYKCVDEKVHFSYIDDAEVRKMLEELWRGMESTKGKSLTAYRRSNIYCADAMASKVRAVVRAQKESAPLDDDILAATEHNRWVIEQLLTGMRPVDVSYAGRLPVTEKDERFMLKSRNVHPDLISYSLLAESAKTYDKAIVTSPLLLTRLGRTLR